MRVDGILVGGVVNSQLGNGGLNLGTQPAARTSNFNLFRENARFDTCIDGCPAHLGIAPDPVNGHIFVGHHIDSYLNVYDQRCSYMRF